VVNGTAKVEAAVSVVIIPARHGSRFCIYIFIYLISKASFRQRRIQKRIGVAAKYGTVKIKPVYGSNRRDSGEPPSERDGEGQDTMEQLDKNPCKVLSFSSPLRNVCLSTVMKRYN